MTDTSGHDVLDVDVGPDDPARDVSVETLRSGLQSSETGVRLKAANVASFVPREDVEKLDAVVPELIDCLDDDTRVVVYQSTIALSLVAEENPAALEDATPRLVELLDCDHSLTQAIVAQALGHVAMDHAEFFVGHVEELVDAALTTPREAVDREALEDPDLDVDERRTLETIQDDEMKRQQAARETAINLLVEVADHDNALVTPHVEDLIGILEDDNPALRMATADLVANVAKEDPSAVADAVTPLCELLDHPNESLVATAVTALGFIGDPAAIEPLESLAADEDRSDDLQELAAETAGFVDAEATQ